MTPQPQPQPQPMPMPIDRPQAGADGNIVGVLLAGGRSRRMGGGDKCLRPLAGRRILDRILDRVAPQVARLMLNANGDPARFAGIALPDVMPANTLPANTLPGDTLPVVADVIDGFAGPLAGVLTGLDWARRHAPDCPWVASIATDAPFLPTDLVARLAAAVRGAGATMACASSGGRSHPVIGLWPVALADALHAAMVEEDMRKVDAWTARYRLTTVAFAPEAGGIDPFFNTNRPDDLVEAERYLTAS